MPLDTVSMDVRPGGSLRLTMFAGPGRHEIHWRGEYREVVEPERLVFTLCDQPSDDAYELVTVVLTDLGDGRTEMHFQQRGQLSAEQYEGAEQGWGVLLRPDRGTLGRRLTVTPASRGRAATASSTVRPLPCSRPRRR